MLLRRGKTYYCRVWVPLDLQERLGRKELKKSLGTADRGKAKAAARLLEGKAATAFFRMGAGFMNERELDQITVSILADFGGRIDAHRKGRGDAFSFLDCGLPIGIDANTDISLLEASFNFPRDPETATAHYMASIERLERQRATGVFDDEIRRLVRRVIAERKLDVELPPAEWFDENADAWFTAPPVSFAQLADAVVEGLIEGYRLELDRVQGRRDPQREAAMVARIEAAKHRPKLSELYEDYKTVKLARGKWRAKAQRKYDDMRREVLQLLGDRELADYSTDDALALIEMLKRKGNEPSTITGKLEFLSSLFRHALKTPVSIGIEN